MFGVRQEHIVVGNGAAELIKALMGRMTGKVGFIRPTFEEYPNRYDSEYSVVFTPENDDYSYTADDLIAFFAGKGLEALVVINPDNPSGNYIPKADALKLMDWSEKENIRLIYDESFADFADEPGNSCIDDEILAGHPRAAVVKSISKSYGVPGLRLGILASGDEALIADMKKDVAIWNINSFGEFYLQIEEKYRSDYAAALERFRMSRANLVRELESIDGVRVVPSQANFLMLELRNGSTATEVAQRMLCCNDILIKDLTPKIDRAGKQYLRVAIRTDDDNARLVDALKCALLDN